MWCTKPLYTNPWLLHPQNTICHTINIQIQLSCSSLKTLVCFYLISKIILSILEPLPGHFVWRFACVFVCLCKCGTAFTCIWLLLLNTIKERRCRFHNSPPWILKSAMALFGFQFGASEKLNLLIFKIGVMLSIPMNSCHGLKGHHKKAPHSLSIYEKGGLFPSGSLHREGRFQH